MTTVPHSVVYARNVIITVNVSVKIRDGTITEINGLTQLHVKNQQSNHYPLVQIIESCYLFKSPNQVTHNEIKSKSNHVSKSNHHQ